MQRAAVVNDSTNLEACLAPWTSSEWMDLNGSEWMDLDVPAVVYCTTGSLQTLSSRFPQSIRCSRMTQRSLLVIMSSLVKLTCLSIIGVKLFVGTNVWCKCAWKQNYMTTRLKGYARPSKRKAPSWPPAESMTTYPPTYLPVYSPIQ